MVTELPEPGVTPGGAANFWRWAKQLNTAITSRYQSALADVGTEATARATADSALQNEIVFPDYIPNPLYTGPVATDSPTVTTGVAVDAAFNVSYGVSGGAIPDDWPFDAYGKMVVASNTWVSVTSEDAPVVPTFRVMSDGQELVLFTYAGFYLDLYIDGRPYTSNPVTLVASAGFGAYGLTKLVFADARPRLIEFRSLCGVVSIFGKAPYRFWKPAPDPNPTIAVVGDSWVYPATLSDTIAAAATPDAYLTGIYQRIPPRLGVTAMTTDGISGSGYINPGSTGPYGDADRLAWLQEVDPDVIVVHGGGTNDLFGGETAADIITAATAYFTTLRTNHPNSKLVFVEGFSPPGFTPGTYNPLYIDIREGVQANLAAAGVDAYFIDVATTQPPIYGTGYVTATTGTGNSDIYVGYDSYHYTIKGATFIRGFLASKIAAVLADNGDLVGELI